MQRTLLTWPVPTVVAMRNELDDVLLEKNDDKR